MEISLLPAKTSDDSTIRHAYMVTEGRCVINNKFVGHRYLILRATRNSCLKSKA